MDTGRNHLLSDLHRFTDIHAHLAPESCEAPAGVLVSLTPAEAVRVLGRPGVAGEYSVGIHPWDSGAPADWDALEALLRHPAAVAVGECGLDALRGPGIGRQEEVLRRHIELSERLGKAAHPACGAGHGAASADPPRDGSAAALDMARFPRQAAAGGPVGARRHRPLAWPRPQQRGATSGAAPYALPRVRFRGVILCCVRGCGGGGRSGVPPLWWRGGGLR